MMLVAAAATALSDVHAHHPVLTPVSLGALVGVLIGSWLLRLTRDWELAGLIGINAMCITTVAMLVAAF
jgi:hypothetical protein